MRKKIIYISIIIFAICLGILWIRFLRQSPEKNGFKRKIDNYSLKLIKAYEFPPGSFYFSGIDNDHLYFQNVDITDCVYELNMNFSNLRMIDLRLHSDVKKNTRISISVIGSTAYIFNRELGIMSTYDFGRKQTLDYHYPKIEVIHNIPISKTSFVAKGLIINGASPQRTLVKVDFKLGKLAKSYVLPKQVDGYFCTDGILRIGSENKNLYYTFFYRGEFLCLDTNFNQLYKAKTIDTITRAVIAVSIDTSRTKKGQLATVTQSTPGNIVNRNFIEYRNYLYITSKIIAENENLSTSKDNQIVDVYEGRNGHYIHSFYIPNYKDFKVLEFKINKEFLYATYNNKFIVKYLIPGFRIYSYKK